MILNPHNNLAVASTVGCLETTPDNQILMPTLTRESSRGVDAFDFLRHSIHELADLGMGKKKPEVKQG